MKMWAFIPARGGSKSIKLKNMALLNGHPLMEYSARAAIECNCFDRIVCSTDHPDIASFSESMGIEIDIRSNDLSGDTVSTRAVLLEFLVRQHELPDYLFIVEPTSPFLRVSDIRGLRDLIERNFGCASAQTVYRPPHTHHAWNQRVISEGGNCSFLFEERKKVSTKQEKPNLYVFGNLIACNVTSLLDGGDVFAEPSVALEIPWPYDVNIDHPDDLLMANIILKSKIVKFDHIE